MRTKRIALSIIMIFVLGAALPLGAQERTLQAVRVKVTAEQANLRERPDIGSGVVQQVPEGTVLLADRKEGEWYLVRFTLEDGGVIAGYIHESLVVVTTQEPGAPVVETRKPVTEATAAPRPKPATPKPSEPVLHPFEFSVSFLGGTVDPADLNDGAQGLIDHYGAFLGLEPSGAADAVGLAFGLGLELSYRISPDLAIGADIVHLRGGSTSTVVYAGEGFSESLTVEPAFQALPINLNVRFYPGRGFYLKGGLGAYHVKAGYLYKFADDEVWRQSKGSATAWTFGAEAAFGGDWKVGRNLIFFAEAGFRLARWSGLDGKDVYSDSLGGNLIEEGTLYAWKQSMGASSYPFLFVREGRPEGAGVSGVRAADINLSGTSIRAGLRFRL